MSEQLTFFIIDGSSMSLYSLIKVGHGSNSHNYSGEFLIILLKEIIKHLHVCMHASVPHVFASIFISSFIKISSPNL